MNGTDHLVPQLRLGRLVAEANDAPGRLRLEVTSLAEHLAQASVDGPSVVDAASCGPGARANLLMGVTSNRVDVRQAAARSRARARTSRSARRAVSARRPVAGGAARRSMAARRAQRGPRLDLRVLDRRSVRRGAVPLRRGGRDRRRTRAARARRARRSRSRATDRSSSIPLPRPRSRSRRDHRAGHGQRPGAQILNERPAERVVDRARPRRRWRPSSCAS